MDFVEKTDIMKPPVEKNSTPTPLTIFRSRWFILALKIFIALVAALLIFQTGMYVGFRKANFSFGWGDNYHKNFGGPPNGFMRGFTGKDMMNGHGAAGTVVSVDEKSLVIKGSDNIEKIVNISDRTSIIKGRNSLKSADLLSGDMVVVIGRPDDDGTINAEMIRVFDAPPIPTNLPMTPPFNR